jgi:signal transduction histidine kinase
VRELIAIREIVHAFLTADRPEEVFQFALDRVSPLVGASFACVYVVDGRVGADAARRGAQLAGALHTVLGEMRVRLGFGPSGEAAAERRVIEVPDVMADPSLEDWAEVAHELGFRAIVALPLQTGDGVLGAVAFYFEEAGAISAETRSLLRMVADQMAATAQKARLIEDLRRTNAALTESNAELERQYVALLEARRVKDEFLANISHELRTPLTAVMGYLALMEEGLAGPVTEEQGRTLAQVKTSSQQLLDLIGDLLELTTLKRGGLEINATAFDVRDPMHDALATTRGRSDAVALRVREPEQPIFMVSDRRKICKLLVALLSNAYKFTTSGEIRLSVTVIDEHVVYRVEDTGIGIPEECTSRCSTSSDRWTARRRADTAGRDWGCRWPAGSRACWVGRSTSTRRRATDRRSGWSCRWSIASPSGCRTPRSPSRSVKLRTWVEGRRASRRPDHRSSLNRPAPS